MDIFKKAAADRHLIGDRKALPPHRRFRLPKVFDIENSDVAIVVLDVHYRFSS